MIKRLYLAKILAQVLCVLFLLALAGTRGVFAQTPLPTCTELITTYTDSDNVDQDVDIDKNNNGLIEICDLEGLNAIRDNRSGSGTMQDGCPSDGCNGYELTRNLDFNNDSSYRTIANRTTYTVTTSTALGWQPIGVSGAGFSATFNGNGYTISNLSINRNGTDDIGLFGATSGQITNLGLLNVDITGRSSVGGLAGRNSNTITNSYVTGTVSGSGSVGGLVGTNAVTITNSCASASVSGSDDQIGGLVGNSSRNSTISNSCATGTISGSGSVGGLVGSNRAAITNSYATGSVEGTGSAVGGLVGFNNEANITNSYATGSVSGLGNNVGGLIGSTNAVFTIENSYATGLVSGSGSNIGGLVGNNPSATITNSYWLDSSASSGGTGVPIDTEKTAVELTSPTAPGASSGDIYYTWSTNDWDFGSSNQFPILKVSDSDALLPNQGIGLRSIQSSTTNAELSPTFREAITFYTITPPGTSSIDLTLIAYNSTATIALVREGEATDYFAGKGSRGSASVPIAANSVLIITVSEPNLDPISYRVVLTTMPPCTFSITADDGDGVAQAMDIDKDGDGLIEICDLEGLDAMRYVLDGSSYQVDATATTSTVGCPSSGCRGYELTRSLDFMDDDSYRKATNRITWTTGRGWVPIGPSGAMDAFRATLDGNGYTISNLMINRGGTSNIGLFGYAQLPIGDNPPRTSIANLGLLNVNITGRFYVGSLAGQIAGTVIINSYATGSVSGIEDLVGGLVGRTTGIIMNSYAAVSVSAPRGNAGGLVGDHDGRRTIRNSYATGRVEGAGDNRGGLVGFNSSRITIENSYATGNVGGTGDHRGGLVGRNRGRINDSYWLDSSASSGGTGVNDAETEKTVEQLTSPIRPGTTATDVYYNWSTDDWDFGTPGQFPALKYAKDTDTNNPTCSDTSPQTSSDQPQCRTLLPHQGMNIEDSSLREGLRELRISGVTASFEPLFGISTNNYVVTINLPAGTTEYDITLRLRAYSPNAEIQIFRGGDDSTNYFEGKMSGQSSSRITVGAGTRLTIRVNEPNTDYALTFATEVGELPGIRVRTKVFLEGPLQ